MARFVVHNARDEPGIDTDVWLVIDTVEGTAVSQNSDRADAENDWVVLTGFYNRWPNARPTFDGLDVNAPMLVPGYWLGRDFG